MSQLTGQSILNCDKRFYGIAWRFACLRQLVVRNGAIFVNCVALLMCFMWMKMLRLKTGEIVLLEVGSWLWFSHGDWYCCYDYKGLPACWWRYPLRGLTGQNRGGVAEVVWRGIRIWSVDDIHGGSITCLANLRKWLWLCMLTFACDLRGHNASIDFYSSYNRKWITSFWRELI
jgi:hypothetical protein